MASSQVFNKLFVANLPWTVGSRELKNYFLKFGPIQYAEVMFDWNTGFSKGFGFVSFVNPEDCAKAAEQPFQILEGGKITIKKGL